MMPPNQFSAQLIASVKEAMERRGINTSQLALELGVLYSTLYQAIHPEKRPRVVMDPTFTYNLGKTLEAFVSRSNRTKPKHKVKS